MREITPSAALGLIVGSKPLARTEVVRKLWVYIKKNRLQDTQDKRLINADNNLKDFFGKKQVSMFEINKLISKHTK